MDVDALIKYHNEELEAEVDKRPGLTYRVFARAQTKKKIRQPISLKIRKYAIGYSLLLLFAIVIHFWIIGAVKKLNVSEVPESVIETDFFHADFPGSISRAYLEVVNWQN